MRLTSAALVRELVRTDDDVIAFERSDMALSNSSVIGLGFQDATR